MVDDVSPYFAAREPTNCRSSDYAPHSYLIRHRGSRVPSLHARGTGRPKGASSGRASTGSECSADFYELTAWQAFQRSRTNGSAQESDAPLISRSDLQQFVFHLRERGVKPVTCNTWLKALQAFCR
jgi:hypothetical protein